MSKFRIWYLSAKGLAHYEFYSPTESTARADFLNVYPGAQIAMIITVPPPPPQLLGQQLLF